MPARKTGVSPILGLMLDPVKGPTGGCCSSTQRSKAKVVRDTYHEPEGERECTHPAERLLLEIATRLVREQQAYLVDALRRRSTSAPPTKAEEK